MNLVMAPPTTTLNRMAHTKMGMLTVTPSQRRRSQPASSDSSTTTTNSAMQIRKNLTRSVTLGVSSFFTASPPYSPRHAW